MDKKLEFSRVYLAALVMVVLLIGFVAGTRSEQLYAMAAPMFGVRVETGELEDSSIQEAYQRLKETYNGRVDDKALLEGAKHGMIAAVNDPYTVYLSKKEADEFNKELSGEIGGGIGAEIGVRNGSPTVIRTLPDNPAQKAGLNAGDVILGVNDESTDGWDAERAVTAIKGEIGTSVKLAIKRSDETKEITIVREAINNPSVSNELRGTSGILTINRFDQETVSLVRKMVTDMKNQGMKRLVVDMRGNGGGYLDAAPGVAGMWLDDKLVVTVKANTGGEQKLFSEGSTLLDGIKTAVVVNGGSASATEIVVGALKHYKSVKVVGEKTYGKGSVQELVPLSGGTLLKVTTKRWYMPDNTNINKKGIQPDVTVGLTQADLDAGHDPQLEKALMIIK